MNITGHVLQRVLGVKKNQVNAIIGNPGAGKSSTVREFMISNRNNSKDGLYIFFDEIEMLDHLDGVKKKYLIRDLKALSKNYDVTSIVSTHDEEIALECDHIIVIPGGQEHKKIIKLNYEDYVR
tara:strand:+ start:169 stop:540 length:372 start_codon:yes stop_codon:yes gene_type:complete